jgi:DNA-binding NarL/FixJ family response regulator
MSSTSTRTSIMTRGTPTIGDGGGASPGDGAASHSITVLCVDDHAVLIEGLKAQFAIDGRIEIIGRLPDASRLVAETLRLVPRVVLLDVEMPGPDAFVTASRLCQVCPAVRIIVLSAHISDALITAAYNADVRGYFAKSDELEDIVAGIREVARSKPGSFLLSPKVREQCRPTMTRLGSQPRRGAGATSAESLDGPEPKTKLSQLTARENEILRLIGKGLSRIQIAEELCRSVKTVDGHQDRIMNKLGITARADLLRYAIREGLVKA